jgi:hypothetical protein
MPKDKYSLPLVDSLKGIGFVFDHGKLNEAIPYIKRFVNNNIDQLISYYFPEQYFYDEDGNIVEIKIWADPNLFEDEFFDGPEKELVEKIVRIEKGDIKPNDHVLLVHPKHRKDKKVILKALNKKLRVLYGATGNLHYRRGIWNIEFHISVIECLYHRVLDDLINSIAEEGKILPVEWNPQYLQYLKKKAVADKYKDTHPGKSGSLFVLSYYLEAEKELENLSNELFSSNLSLEKNARIIIRKALMGGPIVTPLEGKEKTINYYLRLQAKSVNASKDNSKSNKGIQHAKRQSVIDLIQLHPEYSITQISLVTKVNRKTVSKYIKEFMMGKNNLLKQTI